MIEKIVLFIVQELISKLQEKLTDRIKGIFEEHRFKKQLSERINNYIIKNEHTVVSTGDFYNYLIYSDLCNNVIQFCFGKIDVLENDFIDEYLNKAKDCISPHRHLSYYDENAIRGLIIEIVSFTNQFFETKVLHENISLLYNEKQNGLYISELSGKVDILSDQLNIDYNDFNTSKIQYQFPNNTIMRKFALYEDLQTGFSYYIRPENMIDVCLREKRIILLGEAGSGKSIVLEQIAALAFDTDYYPLKYDLKNYVDQTIKDIIFEEYPNIDLEKVFLIFDAFDEIQNKDRSDFARRINDFVVHNQKTIIVISTRSNFYAFSGDNGRTGTLDSFSEYGIASITKNDIKDYLDKNGIDYEVFLENVYKRKISEFIYVPFYLKELASIFKRNNSIPEKARLMDEIIKNRFYTDITKYNTTEDLTDAELDIFDGLEELAFSLQCLNYIQLSNQEYQRLINDKEIRKLIKYSGMFCKDNIDKWGFVHNNFREYLSARYMQRLSIDEIRDIICGSDGKVVVNWYNVLSYLIMIRDDNDLLDYLLDNDIEMVVHFEKSRVDKSKRAEIAIRIIKYYSDKNLNIRYGNNNVEDIVEFGYSEKLFDYLLEHLEFPENNLDLFNSILIISEVGKLVSNNDSKIRIILLDIIKSENLDNFIKVKAIKSIAKLKLSSNEITQYLLLIFQYQSDDIRLAILSYLNIINNYENNIDLYIQELKNTRDRSNIINMKEIILDTFSKVKNVIPLRKIIIALSNKDHFYSSSYDKEQYEAIIDNAVELHNKGKKSIMPAMVEAITESYYSNRYYYQYCKLFFKKTSTLSELFIILAEKLLNEDNYKISAILYDIGDNECYTILLDKAKADNQYIDIINLMVNSITDNTIYCQYIDYLENHNIIVPERPKSFDYGKTEINAKQTIFDLLFDKNEFVPFVEEFVGIIKDENMMFSELSFDRFYDKFGNNYCGSEDNYYKYNLYYYLFSILDNYKSIDSSIVEFIAGFYNWDYFIVDSSVDLIEGGIFVSDKQREFFENYCRREITNIDFKEDIVDVSNNRTQFSKKTAAVVKLSIVLNIDYEKKYYLNMLSVPHFLFKTKDSNHKIEIPQYLTERLDIKEIEQQIMENLSAGVNCKDILFMYINYCKEHNLNIMCSKALEICKSDVEFGKYDAIDYLESLKGYEWIYDNLLEINDFELIKIITERTLKYKDIRLKEKLEEIIDSVDNKQDFLPAMIMLNSPKGLNVYLQMLKELMTVPNSYIYYSQAFAGISDISLLPLLGEFETLSFSEEFNDLESFGLENMLFKAYCNLAKYDYQMVKKHLSSILLKFDISDDEKGFCNAVLIDVERSHSKDSVKNWDIDQIKIYLKNHKE